MATGASIPPGWTFGLHYVTPESVARCLAERSMELSPQEEQSIREDAREVAESLLLLFSYHTFPSGREEAVANSISACFCNRYDPSHRRIETDRNQAVRETSPEDDESDTFSECATLIEGASPDSESTCQEETWDVRENPIADDEGFDVQTAQWVLEEIETTMDADSQIVQQLFYEDIVTPVVHNRITLVDYGDDGDGQEVGLWWKTCNNGINKYELRVDTAIDRRPFVVCDMTCDPDWQE